MRTSYKYYYYVKSTVYPSGSTVPQEMNSRDPTTAEFQSSKKVICAMLFMPEARCCTLKVTGLVRLLDLRTMTPRLQHCSSCQAPSVADLRYSCGQTTNLIIVVLKWRSFILVVVFMNISYETIMLTG